MTDTGKDTLKELLDAAARNDLKTFKSIIEDVGVSLFRPHLLDIVEEAIKKGYLELMQYIIEVDPLTIEQRDKWGQLIIHVAAESGSLAAVRSIAREKPQTLLRKNRNGETIAHIAARRGFTDIIQFIVDECPTVMKKKDSYHRTLLHSAIENNTLDTETLKLIDQKRISMLAESKSGECIVSIAARLGNLEIVQYVARRKPSTLDRPMLRGDTVAHIAAAHGHLNIIKYVAEKQPNVFELKNDEGLTVAHVAARHGQLEVIQCIAECLPSMLKQYGRSIVEMACNNGHPDVVRFMMKKNETVIGEVDNDGNTVIHRAVRRNLTDVKTVKFFVEEGGIPLSRANKKNQTIADFAIRNGNSEIIRYVKEKEPSLLGARVRRRRGVDLVPPSVVVHKLSGGRVFASSSARLTNHNEMSASNWSLERVFGYGQQLTTTFLSIGAFVFGGNGWKLSSHDDDAIDDRAAVALRAVETFQYLEND